MYEVLPVTMLLIVMASDLHPGASDGGLVTAHGETLNPVNLRIRRGTALRMSTYVLGKAS